MQEIKKKETQLPQDPKSQPLTPGLVLEVESQDHDPDEIFFNAIAEIDTQPLIKRKRTRVTLSDVLQTIICVSLIGVGCFSIVWQAITYPHTLVILFANEKPAHITVTLVLPTRTLTPVTVSRSQTSPTTGHGHLDATQAAGQLTFYNASFTSQTIQAGSVFTGADGVQIRTNETVTIPANNPPQDGIASVPAHAQNRGSRGNIAAFDINGQVSGSLYVKNLAAFTDGSNARDFQAVAKNDLVSLTSTLRSDLFKQIPQAFRLRKGETVLPTTCTYTATPDYATGDEASSITAKASETCKGIAYSQDDLKKQATTAFTTTRPGTQYQLVSTIQTSIETVSPFTVQIKGLWAYIFTKDYEQRLAEQIQGDSPKQAKAILLATGVISQVSIPNTLPPVMYINFLVLVGK